MISKAVLIQKYSPMIDYLIRTLRVPDNFKEDIKQESMITLLKCRKSFNPKKGNLSNHVFFYLRKHISEYLYINSYPYGMSPSFYYKEIKSGKTIETCNIDYIPEQIDSTKSLDRYAIVKLFVEKLNHKFSKTDCKIIIDYYIEGETYKTLCKRYGNISKIISKINSKEVNKILTELREEFV